MPTACKAATTRAIFPGTATAATVFSYFLHKESPAKLSPRGAAKLPKLEKQVRLMFSSAGEVCARSFLPGHRSVDVARGARSQVLHDS